MSRNVRAAATALALAGGVYLAGAPAAEASNMGFKLERSFDLVRRTADNRPLFNIYWVSFPLFDGTGDVANTAFAGANKCVGDADGPPAGDGIVNSDDKVCEHWTARVDPATAGVFTISWWDPMSCTNFSRTGTIGTLTNRPAFQGVPFDLQEDIGYQVQITVRTGRPESPQNRAVIVGSHDPSFAGRTIRAAPDCTTPGQTNCCGSRATRRDLINLVYHTMYSTSYEILCGLEGVDWVDADGNSRPDTCWDDVDGDLRFDVGEPTTGVFDGRVAMSVSYWNNTEAVNAPVNHNVTINPLNQLLTFSATPFDLVPGDAYMLIIDKRHTDTTFLSPHF